MKALSLSPKDAYYVWSGEKSALFRTQATDFRGDFVICAGSATQPGYIGGYALCVTELLDVVPFSENHLEAACMDRMPTHAGYAWILGPVREIVPFPQEDTWELADLDEGLVRFVPIQCEKDADDYFDRYLKPLYEQADSDEAE